MSTNISQQFSELFSDASLKFVVATCLLPVFVYFLSFLFQQSSEFPFINYDKSQWTYKQAKSSFNSHAKMLIREGFKKVWHPFLLVLILILIIDLVFWSLQRCDRNWAYGYASS